MRSSLIAQGSQSSNGGNQAMTRLIAFTTWQNAANGFVDNELGLTDGTTTTVLDRWTGSTSGVPNKSQPTAFVQLGSKLFFTADSAAGGYELWSSDGTLAGTQQFLDIRPGTADAFQTQLIRPR
jgi:ELWxxDGT repeat protein